MEHLIQGFNGVDGPECIELHKIWEGRTPIAAPGVQMQFRQRHVVFVSKRGRPKSECSCKSRPNFGLFTPVKLVEMLKFDRPTLVHHGPFN